MTYKEKLIYCAGLTDGEGSLILSKTVKNNKKSYRPSIKISMNDIHGLLVFQSLFGGNINIGTKKVNSLTRKEYSPAYVLSYASESKVKQILEELYPYLQVKKEQSEIVHLFVLYKEAIRENKISKFSGAGILNNLYIKCKKLKSKNWIIKK
jgi:hypothetical protein